MTGAPSSLAQFCDWLSGTPVSLVIQSVRWIVPAVQTVHILAIAVVLSSIGMINLRIMGLAGTRTTIADTARRYVPWIWGALVVLLCSGSVLIIGEPARSLLNWAFQCKMALLAVGIVALAAFRVTVTRNAGIWTRAPRLRASARIVALGVFILFLAIAVLGRWIAYAVTTA